VVSFNFWQLYHGMYYVGGWVGLQDLLESTERKKLHLTRLELRSLERSCSRRARIAQLVATGCGLNEVLFLVGAKLSSSHFVRKCSGACLAPYPKDNERYLAGYKVAEA
jgi:hypothetical protein